MASRAGNARAAADLTFEELYRGYHEDVFRAALRELGNVQDAEDVTQAAFADAYRAVLGGTRPQSPRAWLLAISENVRRRRFRTAQRRPRELPLDSDLPVAADPTSEQAHALAAALAALPPEQRRVFVLRELGGHSYDEIADEVDSTVGSVQMLLFRARRSLREELDPPVVAPRRTGVLVPAPGWLLSLASRFEVAGLTPRVAGAVGAAVLAVVATSVPVPQAPAGRAPSVPSEARPDVAASPEPTVAQPAAPKLRAAAAGRRGPSAEATPVARPGPVATRSPAPAAAGTPAPPALTIAQETSAAPAPAAPPPPEPPRLPVPVPVPVPVEPGEVVSEVSLPPLPAASPSLAPLPAPVSELAAGAAGAAGASAPPLPVEVPPLPALPPAP